MHMHTVKLAEMGELLRQEPSTMLSATWAQVQSAAPPNRRCPRCHFILKSDSHQQQTGNDVLVRVWSSEGPHLHSQER